MKKLLLIPLVFAAAACSTGRPSGSKLNCERLHKDSSAKLEELQKVFVAYQDINVDLATKLSPAFKSEVSDLDTRIRKQRQKCWPSEKRPIDGEIALLKEEVLKIYGEFEVAPRRERRSTASVVEQPLLPAPPAPRQEAGPRSQFAPSPETSEGSASEALENENQEY